jgi:DNA integrity scanning protein DisA with diadenylate cyclase activity
MKGTILAFCLVGMLVLPAAASSGTSQGTNGNVIINNGLLTELWNNHVQYRLQEFDNHVQNANNIIAILGQYNIDTSQLQATLSTISGMRPELQTALQDHDTASLKTINAQLAELWKQFRTEKNEAIRNYYHTAQPLTSSVTSDTGSGSAAVNPVSTTTPDAGTAAG